MGDRLIEKDISGEGSTRDAPKARRYGAYYQRMENRDNTSDSLEILETGPGTSMGECMRRYWQPVCLSQELKDVPKAIRILHEDLVAFRDRSGRVGVLKRHCAHRGASLEYGIVSQRGIRCCYHGWLYDVDGTVLETPAEPPESRLKETVCQGAYPAFERDGLVFAYMGAPESTPKFEEFDAYVYPEGTRLVPFSNVFDCNWVQVYENLIDHYHTALLHNNMTVEGVDAAIATGTSLGGGFGEMPIIKWEPTRGGKGLMFSAGRRVSDDTVWVRISEMRFPNYCLNASLVPSAIRVRHGNAAMTRWQVPVDDEHSIAFGWRHFNDLVDPEHYGREDDCGVDKIDFLVGQTRHRGYDAKQRAPGDYEAITSQGAIASHAREHPGRSDVGVYMCRSLLRRFVRGKTPRDSGKGEQKDTIPALCSDSVVRVPKRSTLEEDREAIANAAAQVVAIMAESQRLPYKERRPYVLDKLDAFDGGLIRSA